MALDGIFLHSILSELKKDLINSKIDKVNQPEKDEIILTIRGNGFTKKLLISASANFPRIHFTNQSKSNPLKAPMFCMVLRKYMIGGKIQNVEQLAGDRILTIEFENTDELGFNSLYTLIVEIMGRHSNITLVRKRDNQIMDSIKHITPDINSYRNLYPGIQYISPPESSKLDPFNFDENSFINFISENAITIKESIFSNIFNGVSGPLSKELFQRFQVKDSYEDLKNIVPALLEFFNDLKNNNFEFIIYGEQSSFKDFYCIPLSIYSHYNALSFTNASELLEYFFSEKDKADRLNSKSSDLQKLINVNIERCNKKNQILNNTLSECKDKDFYKIQGELLTANIYCIKKGDSKVTVLNYYSENADEYSDIKLDVNKSPSENIQFYFKKYTKLKKSEEAAKEQLTINYDEIQYLQSVLTNIKNSETYEEIEEIRNELVETGYIKFKKEYKNKKAKTSKPLHFLSSDGLDIYVGKNNYQNDFLTLKFADKNDMWMHTKNIPGSHVIIKHKGDIPEKTLEEAAVLAAFYSKAKESAKVPIDYTQVKNVKKPSGAKPGMVIYYTNKTVYVDPYDINLKKV